MQLNGRLCCVFCGHGNPTEDHLEQHKFSACLRQPDDSRVFRRKDHLRQHLRLFHGGCEFNDNMEAWLSSIGLVRSRCGFCEARMATWAERQTHLAAHFRNGSNMLDWKGDRGFDSEIDNLVENDIPAFLIGGQSKTTEPFSALHASHVFESPGRATQQIPVGGLDELGGDLNAEVNQSSHGPTMHSYRHIERLLLDYVSAEIQAGRVPSDSQLQSKTSDMMYGPGNTWDQTWADLPDWLEMFKKKAGLITLPLSGGRNAFVGRDVP